jgi:hypothetical protein
MTLFGGDHGTTATRDDSGVDTKSFEIPKRLIWGGLETRGCQSRWSGRGPGEY